MAYTSFDNVVDNYTWGQSQKNMVNKLRDFKDSYDKALHDKANSKLMIYTEQKLPTSNIFNEFTEELITIITKLP